MRPGAGTAPTGFCHEAVLYDTDQELVDVALAFITEGVEAGEPTFVSLDDERYDVIAPAIAHLDGVRRLEPDGQYGRPALAIENYRKLFVELVEAGAAQIRVIGNVPVCGPGTAWQPWARYEAFVNEAFDPFPLWGMCVFDTRTTPEHVLDDACSTHTHLAADHDHQPNDRFEDPTEFLRSHLDYPDLPLQATPPVAELVDPLPGQARQAVGMASASAHVAPAELDGLITAVSEVVTNATVHGRHPVEVRAWVEADQVVVTVADGGEGPADPAVGLAPVPRQPGEGGLGLWIANQLCDEVTMRRRDDGFTVRLTARASR